MTTHYEPIWTGLDPENRAGQLAEVIVGSVFAGKSTHTSAEGGTRPLLVFEKAGWGRLGIAPPADRPPILGCRERPWWHGREDADAIGWQEASGREVALIEDAEGTIVGPDGVPAGGEAVVAIALVGDMTICLRERGKAFYLRAEAAESEA